MSQFWGALQSHFWGACTAGGIRTFRHSRYFRQRAKCGGKTSPPMDWASSPTPSSRPKPPPSTSLGVNSARRSGGTYFDGASANRSLDHACGFARDDGKKCVMASRRGRERHAKRICERINDAKSGNTEKQRNSPYYNLSAFPSSTLVIFTRQSLCRWVRMPAMLSTSRGSPV